MFYHKTGYPEVSDVVLCTVTRIQSHSVFVQLDEYKKPGMIHISEIAPGRIRNIRDYVRDGKKVVCKVLRITLERGHIDLSLRRVNENQRLLKIEELKQEQVAEKIIETVAIRLKRDFEEFYNEVAPPIFKEYDMLHYCFNDVVQGNVELASLGMDKKFAAELDEVVRARIQPPEVLIEGILGLTSYAPNGVEIVKEALAKLLEAATEEGKITLTYKGSGKYRLVVTAPDYKQAEAVLKDATTKVTDQMEEHDGTARFERKE